MTTDSIQAIIHENQMLKEQGRKSRERIRRLEEELLVRVRGEVDHLRQTMPSEATTSGLISLLEAAIAELESREED